MSPSFSTDEVLNRLETLHGKLVADGAYVSANTVGLAVDEIKRLESEWDVSEKGRDQWETSCAKVCGEASAMLAALKLIESYCDAAEQTDEFVIAIRSAVNAGYRKAVA